MSRGFCQKGIGMTLTTTKNLVQPHGFILKTDAFENQSVLAIYLPVEMISFLHTFSFEYQSRFKFGEFRTMIEGRYPSIISIHLSSASLQGEEPWMYLSLASLEDVEFLYWEFYRWIEGCLEEDEESLLLIPSEVKQAKMPYLEVDVASLFHDTRTFPAFMKGYLATQMIETGIPASFKQVGNDASYPTVWYKAHNGSGYEVVSHPLTLSKEDAKTPLKASIAGRLEVVRSVDDWHVHVYFSLRRWLVGLHPKKRFHYNSNKKSYDYRSFYVVNPIWKSPHMLRLSIAKSGQSARFTHERSTIEWLKRNRLELDPLETILSALDQYQDSSNTMVLIPYVAEDKNKNGNYLEVGLNTVDHYNLFLMIQFIFPTLSLLHPLKKLRKEDWEAPNVSTSYKGGHIRVDVSNTQKEHLWDQVIPIHVYSTRTMIQEEVKAAIETLFSREKQNGGSNYKVEPSSQQENRFDVISRSDESFLHDFSIEFIYHTWDSTLFGPLECSSFNEYRDATLNRIERFKALVSPSPAISHALVEIGEYESYNAHTDPKQSVKLGFLERNMLTQCFYGKDVNLSNRLLKSIQDILATKGFLNQHIQSSEAVLNHYVFYMPYVLVVGYGRAKRFIYTIARYHRGMMHVKYEQSNWLTLEESLTYLTLSHQRMLVQRDKRNFSLFWRGCIQSIENAEPIVIFEKHLCTANDSERGFTFMTYEFNTSNVPYVSYFKNNELPSKGTYLARTNDGYVSIAAKMPTDTKANSFMSKLDYNKMYVNRVPIKLQFQSINGKEVNKDQMAYAVHLLRNITVTFESFVNHPYPLHMLKQHHELLLF